MPRFKWQRFVVIPHLSLIAKRRTDQALALPIQSDEIDLLIATDCISEGQNPQTLRTPKTLP